MGSNTEFFSQAQRFSVNNSPITVNHLQTTISGGDLSAPLAKLSSRCAFGAFLNSAERGDPPTCMPKTRQRLLSHMGGWATGGDEFSSAMWLSGSAGSGKTALSQTVAEELREKGYVLSCHFFFRTSKDGQRADGYRWAPNLIHEMIRVLPETLPFVERAIHLNDSVFGQHPEALLYELFVKPLIAATGSNSKLSFRRLFRRFRRSRPISNYSPKLIVIDGLDECNSPHLQEQILRAIAKTIPKLPIPIRFLIASRPETHIRNAIDREFKNCKIIHINLDEDQDVLTDLKEYYDQRFNEIRRNHISLRGLDNWPCKEDIDILVTKSSTQFIFAATVMRYISQQRGLPGPVGRLKIILGMSCTPRDDRPFLQLDTLYEIILLTVDEADLRLVRLILTFIYMAGTTDFPYLGLKASPKFIEDLLHLETGDVPRLLDPLVSILELPAKPDDPIKMLHASFFDYFRDPVRSTNMSIPLEEAHEAIACWYFDEMEKLSGWQIEKSSLNVENLDRLLRHASLANMSWELALRLYAIQGNMVGLIMSPKTSGKMDENILGNYIVRICTILSSKLGKMRQNSINSYDNNTLVHQQRESATLIIRLICDLADVSILDSLMPRLQSAVRCWRYNTPALSGNLSADSCPPLIRELFKKQSVATLYRKDLLKVLEHPGYFGIDRRADADFAPEVLNFLNALKSIRPVNAERITQKEIDDVFVQWNDDE
ncbi:hypothetical protein CPB83DRAFT_882771 [Crepidotus variabilis]|uniref:NACHT domain-containing protein n=1 Tax=Crepidotus variabilis TaxID=179855 RepID=A0A9P6EH81_9AGAR|nr:hypothetical protein CPB83DRAFT_882771 [Crepidotus variabilis]